MVVGRMWQMTTDGSCGVILRFLWCRFLPFSSLPFGSFPFLSFPLSLLLHVFLFNLASVQLVFFPLRFPFVFRFGSIKSRFVFCFVSSIITRRLFCFVFCLPFLCCRSTSRTRKRWRRWVTDGIFGVFFRLVWFRFTWLPLLPYPFLTLSCPFV